MRVSSGASTLFLTHKNSRDNGLFPTGHRMFAWATAKMTSSYFRNLLPKLSINGNVDDLLFLIGFIIISPILGMIQSFPIFVSLFLKIAYCIFKSSKFNFNQEHDERGFFFSTFLLNFDQLNLRYHSEFSNTWFVILKSWLVLLKMSNFTF